MSISEMGIVRISTNLTKLGEKRTFNSFSALLSVFMLSCTHFNYAVSISFNECIISASCRFSPMMTKLVGYFISPGINKGIP